MGCQLDSAEWLLGKSGMGMMEDLCKCFEEGVGFNIYERTFQC